MKNPLPKIKIGIVESNERILNCFVELFNFEQEYKVVFATQTGKIALKELNQNKCDILLSAENLKDVDAIEFLNASKEIQPSLNVLFLINEQSQLFFKQAAEYRATTLITKHIEPIEFLDIVKRVNKAFC
jgi:DNA-binding NarL/FixJ family response regulator